MTVKDHLANLKRSFNLRKHLPRDHLWVPGSFGPDDIVMTVQGCVFQADASCLCDGDTWHMSWW